MGKLQTLVPVAAEVALVEFAFVQRAVFVFDVVQHTLLVGCKLVHQIFLTHLQVVVIRDRLHTIDVQGEI